MAFQRTASYGLRAIQRRWTSGRSQDQFRTNADILYFLIVPKLADKEFCRSCTHFL
jgi:hypothetical protein